MNTNNLLNKVNKPIILLGFMGCGKTTVGKIMADLLSIDFLDLDELIVSETHSAITDYFKEHGEEKFRKIERDVLHKTLLSNSNMILALGGGAPCFFDNINFIKKHATSIYLQATPQLIVSRIQKKKIMRPLIKNIPGDELTRFVNSLLRKRRKFYKQADIRVRVNTDSDTLGKRIIERRLAGYTTS